MKGKSESEVAQSCLTLSDPVDCSLPGSSIHGIFQAKYWSGVPLPSLEQQQLYWNYNLPQILILRRFLDNFHYYLASKLLEFIKFVSYYYYLLLLGCVLTISILIFLMALKNLEFAIFVLVTLTASLLPNFKNLLHYSKGIKKFSLQNWIDSLPKWKVRVKDAHSSFCLVAILVVCRNLLDFYLKLCLTLCFKIML